MKKFFALIKKPTDVLEVYSIIEFYKIQDVTLCVKDLTWSTYPVLKKYCISKIKKKVSRFKIEKIYDKNIAKINWLKKLKSFNLVALPINTNRNFYEIFDRLKSNGTKTILISDGVIDSFNIIKYVLATRKNLIRNFLKLLFLTYFFYFKNAKSNECFFTCYPLKATFSKKTFPVSKNFLPDRYLINILKKNKVKNLILGGKGIVLKEFLKKYSLTNYCYIERLTVNKKKTIIINGKSIKINNTLIAEEIINTNLIKNLYSYLNTTCFYGKYKKINVEVIFKKFTMNPPLLFIYMKQKFSEGF